MKLAFLSVFLALPLMAQTKAPEIPVALQAKFWKVQAQAEAESSAVKDAQQKLTVSQASLASIVKELQAACGKDFQPRFDDKGDPACVSKEVKK